MGKSHESGDSGIGGSLRNSLSKLTSRVTVKAPSADELKKAQNSKPASPRPVITTPKPMTAPNVSQSSPAPAHTPKQKPAPAPQPTSKPAPAASPASQSTTSHLEASSSQRVNKLANDVQIQGKLRFTDRLIFDGRIKGEITSNGALTIQGKAIVEASVSVKTLLVEGKIIGNIHATESVRLGATSVVIGDISTGRLTVEPHASFKGQAKIGSPTAKPNQASVAATNQSSPQNKPQSGSSVSKQISGKMPAPPTDSESKKGGQ